LGSVSISTSDGITTPSSSPPGCSQIAVTKAQAHGPHPAGIGVEGLLLHASAASAAVWRRYPHVRSMKPDIHRPAQHLPPVSTEAPDASLVKMLPISERLA